MRTRAIRGERRNKRCLGCELGDRLATGEKVGLHAWEMTRQEWAGPRPRPNHSPIPDTRNAAYICASCDHPRIVREALSLGLAVPDRVLADYPELSWRALGRG